MKRIPRRTRWRGKGFSRISGGLRVAPDIAVHRLPVPEFCFAQDQPICFVYSLSILLVSNILTDYIVHLPKKS